MIQLKIKTQIAMWAILILFAGFAYALDQEMYIPMAGDDEIYFAQYGDEQFESYFNGSATTASPAPAPAGGGSGGTGPLYTKVKYDVFVNVLEELYRPGQKVEVEIIIRNVGDVPDEDAILTYYLLDPEMRRIKESQEQFFEVPPTYYGEAKCVQYGGIIDDSGACVTKLRRSITLPMDADRGQWKFHVDYDTAVQHLIKVYDSFDVYGTPIGTIIIYSSVGGAGFFLLLFGALFARKKMKKQVMKGG